MWVAFGIGMEVWVQLQSHPLPLGVKNGTAAWGETHQSLTNLHKYVLSDIATVLLDTDLVGETLHPHRIFTSAVYGCCIHESPPPRQPGYVR